MYNENEKAIIWLSLFEKLSYAKQKALLELYSEPQHILKRLYTDEVQIRGIVGYDIYCQMLETGMDKLEKFISSLDKHGIKCLTIFSKDYPEKLLLIDQNPLILFAKGNLGLLNKKGIAIVGTRNPCAYGREVTEKFARELSKAGVVIISGLASGVDKIAHESTLSEKGQTIAVLGGGFNHIYPSMNTNLAKEISEKGLLISEYRPDLFATKYTFPFRNRIISGLSEAVLLTECGKKSGSLYTKEFAKIQGKLIFSVPANINNIRAEGTNNLLKTREAILTLSPKDILEKCGISFSEVKEEENVQVDITEKQILDALGDKNQTFDELMEITGLETKSLNTYLTMLQIRGLIKKLPGNEFSL